MASSGTVVLTGANGGLGSAIAQQIVHNTPGNITSQHGLFIVRSSKTSDTLNAILSSAPPIFHHQTISIDLSSLASVRSGAAEINTLVAEGKVPKIRALIISAGFQEMYEQTFTADGFDMTFQVNYLSQWLLVLLLLQSMDKENGRIVIVSGQNHDSEDPRNDMTGIYKEARHKTLYPGTETLAKGTWCSFAEDPTSMSGQRRYGAAHLLEVMFMLELQQRLSSDPSLAAIRVVGLDPGAMPTDICRREGFLIRVVVMKLIFPLLNPVMAYFYPNGFLRTPWKSGGDVLRAAYARDVQGGSYWNGTDPWPVSKEARDAGKREMLWRDSVELVGLKEDQTVLKAWK